MPNIEQTQQLNKLLEQQSKVFEQQDKLLKSQADTMKRMVDSMEKLSEGSFGEIGKFDDLGKALEKAASDMEKVGKSGDGTKKSIFDFSKTSVKNIDIFGKKLQITGKLAIGLSILGSIFDGIGSGINFVLGGIKSFTNLLFAAGRAVFDFGLAILTAPFKILGNLMEMAGDLSTEFREALEGIRKEFGDLSTTGGAAIKSLNKEMRGGLAETGLSTFRVFGKLSDRIKFVAEVAGNLGATFDVLTGQLSGNMERFGAYIKGLGLSSEAIEGLGEASFATGKNITEFGREITTFAFGVGESFGLSGKMVSRDLGAMTKDFSNFGNLSTKTMANVSVFARRLGVDFTRLLGVVAKFDDFESAADGAAQLAQAFGLNVDALKLVEAQDPAERIELLRKSFFAAGRSIESMTRQERALLEQQTGLEQSTLRMVFSNKNKAISYKEIQKQTDATSKKQLTQEEAMQKLSNSIERLVFNLGQGKSFLSIFFGGIESGIKHTGPFIKMLTSLRGAMNRAHMAGRVMGRFFIQNFPGISTILENMAGVFKRISGFFSSLTKRFTDSKKPIKGFQDGIMALKETFSNFLEGAMPNIIGILDGFKKVTSKLGSLAGEAVSFMMEGLTKGLKNITSLPKMLAEALSGSDRTDLEMAHVRLDPSNIKDVLQHDMKKSFSNLFTPIWESMKEQWPALRDSLVELFQKAIEEIKDPVATAMKDFIWWAGKWAAILIISSALIKMISTSFAGLILSGLGIAIKWIGTKVLLPLIVGLGKAIGAAFLAITPVGWAIILGVAVLATASVLIYKYWDKIKNFFIETGKWLKEKLAKLGESISSAWDAIVETVSDFSKSFIESFEKIITWFSDSYTKVKDVVFNFFSGVFNSIKEKFDEIKTAVFGVGGDLIDGLINGIKQKWNDIKTAITDVGTAIKDTFTSFFKTRSPSKVFEEYGENLSEGLAIGIGENKSILNAISENNKLINQSSTGGMGAQSFSFDSDKIITSINDGLIKIDSFLTDASMKLSSMFQSFFTTLGSNTNNMAYITGKSMSNIFSGFVQDAVQVPLSIQSFSSNINKSLKLIQGKSIEKISSGVVGMISEINKMSSAIKNVSDVNISSDLKILANKLGLGSNEKLEINMKDLKININVDVKLLVEDIEEAMLTKPGGSKFTFSLSEGS